MKTIFAIASLILLIHQSANSQKITKWTFKTQGRIYSSPYIDEQMIYFGSNDFYCYALDKHSGAQIWAFQTQGEVRSSPLVWDNMVYFGSADGAFYALDKKKGRLIWKFQTEGEQMLDLWDYYLSSPRVHNGIVYFGSGDGHIYALDCISGALKWKFQTGAIVHAEPVIFNETIYIGDYQGKFYALDAGNGQLKWDFKTIGARYFPKGEIQKGAAQSNGILYFGSRDYNVYALDALAGHGHWNMKEQGSWVIATPLVHDDYLYFGTSDTHRFYCFKKSTGQLVWQIPVPMRVYGSAIQHKGVVYFGCFDGIVRGVDLLTGQLLWSYQTPASKSHYAEIYNEKAEFRPDFELYGNRNRKFISWAQFWAHPLLIRM